MLSEKILGGDRRAVSRLISMIEDGDPESRRELASLYKHTGRAHIVGITGPPGAGKSTLVCSLIKKIREKRKTVGIIAVDPTSPFSGGALLGDRIRMQDSSLDPGVFIRSMGTRGRLGGLAKATSDAIKVLDAFGKDYILVETVGAGQSEVDIVKYAHTVVLVLVPHYGDEIQIGKAGIIEIGNIFVINKADFGGADKTALEIKTMLELGEKRAWTPPILQAISREDSGTGEILGAIDSHMDFLRESSSLSRMAEEKVENELLELLRLEVETYILNKVGPESFEDMVLQVASRKVDPYTACEKLLETINHKD
jgi:LAO/AO transport system kinase